MEFGEPVKKKSKKRYYNVQWENQYGLVKFDANTAFCVLCKPPKLFTHFLKTNHENHYFHFHLDFSEKPEHDRIEFIKLRKALLSYEMAEQVDKSAATATRISFLIAQDIAKEMLPLEHGEGLKTIVQKFNREIFNTCPKLQKEAEEAISNVPLSRKVITNRIQLMSDNIYSQIDEDLQRCDYFSLQLDETTDVNDIAQIIIFIRMVFPDLLIKEECFGFLSLHDRISADEIFKNFETLMESRNVPLNKLVSVAGSQNGFLAKCKINKKFPQFNTYHRISHQQVFCAKASHINEVIDEVVLIIKFIRGQANQTQFKELIEDMDENSDGSDIIYYTEVRWLSKANMLQRFVDLLPTIQEFLSKKEKVEWVGKLQNFEWLSLLMYVVDLTLIINSANKQLQGRCKLVWEQLQVVRDLELTLVNIVEFCKINVIDERLQRLKKLYSECPGEKFNAELLIKVTMPILDEITKRFQDFRDIEIIGEIIMNPFSITIERYEGLIETIKRLFPNAEWINFSDLINEFQSLPRDNKIIAVIASGGDMWNVITKSEKYPTFLKIYKKLSSIFGLTWLNESGFSFMKKIKTKERSRLTGENLMHLMNLKTSQREPNISHIISKMECKKSHCKKLKLKS